ncbi:MAG: fimbrillin family protein [Dysgonomonas sp.]
MAKSTNILHFLYISIIALFMGGCTESDDSDFYNNSYISLSPYINENTKLKATNSSFEENDNIGVFAVPFINGNSTEGDMQTDKYATNIKTTYNASEWISESPIPWYSGHTKVTLYSYHPYNIAASSGNVKNYSFTIKENQSNVSDFKNNDFLWAKSDPSVPTKNKISLPFTHRMSKIRINIKTENGFVAEEIINSTKKIKSIYVDGTVNLSDGSVTIKSDSKKKDIVPYQLPAASTSYDVSVEAIVLPQTISASTDMITLSTSDNSTPYSYKPTSDLVLSSGKMYTFNINIDRTGISVSTESIKDWESYPDIEGNINQPAYKAFDISSLDWSKTRVYKVFDNGIQVAEVAKEYLYKRGIIDVQAIVVYKMSDNGQTDISSGFVVQVMSTTKNAVNEYDPDVNNIHGGNVIWDLTNNVISAYTKGTGSRIDKIEINKGIPIAAQPHAIYTLTLVPDLAKDVDNNEYGIVKIGKQFWMRENLKTEHFRDGSAAEVYYYNDDIKNKEIYGGLYDWTTTVNTKGLAPQGWHVFSYNEFTSLSTYISGTNTNPYYAAGAKLKAARLWTYYYNNTDITGFSALPGGRRAPGGTYSEWITYGQWWTSTEYSNTAARRMYLDYSNTGVWMAYLAKTYYESVRCLRD